MKYPKIANVDPDVACDHDTQFFIPNIFSPNGDQVNDAFTLIFNSDAEVISVTGNIFDRWGNHVYGSDDLLFHGMVRFADKPMNPGVYVYTFTLVYSDGVNVVAKKLVGDVTLIR
jgi:gliding motility-associated-like protein